MIKTTERKIKFTCSAALIALMFITLFVFSSCSSKERVFVYGQQTVTLKSDGTFVANLSHNETKSGTYTEENGEDIITVTFTYDNTSANGIIIIANNVLLVPDEWDDGHGHSHGVEFKLKD